VTWDVLLLRVRPEIVAAEELSEEAVIPLGTPAEVRAGIQRVCPEARFSDETTGRLEAPTYAIQFSLGDENPVRGVLLLITGGAEAVLPVITALCGAHNWRAFDMNTEDFIELA
jgi:hypothetical protein